MGLLVVSLGRDLWGVKIGLSAPDHLLSPAMSKSHNNRSIVLLDWMDLPFKVTHITLAHTLKTDGWPCMPEPKILNLPLRFCMNAIPKLWSVIKGRSEKTKITCLSNSNFEICTMLSNISRFCILVPSLSVKLRTWDFIWVVLDRELTILGTCRSLLVLWDRNQVQLHSTWMI